MELPAKGSLSDSGFIKLIIACTESKFTGMIRLETGPVIKVVYFQQGNVAFASSNEKSDRLTEVLKRAGKLTPEQIEHAQARLKPNVSLGKTLVELGYISPKDLLWGARMQVESILQQLLFWDRGNYQVIEGPLPKEIVSLNMAVPQILFDGILKSQDRDWVLQRIGSPEAVFQLDAAFHEKNAAYRLPVEDTVSRMNGKRSLEEIAQAAGQDAFEVCKAVAALQILKMVQIAPETSAPAPVILSDAVQQETPTLMEMAPVAPFVPKQDISLGQILQIPTVEQLQREQEPEQQPEPEPEPEATLIVPPAAPPPVFSMPAAPRFEPPKIERPSPPRPVFPAPPAPVEPPKMEPPTAAMRPSFVLEEEEEDTETIKGRVAAEEPEPDIPTAAHSPAEPTQRFEPPTFGDRKEQPVPMESLGRHRKRPEPTYVTTLNWKKIALAMGLVAALAIAGTFVYTRFLQKPPEVEYPAPKPVEPLSRPAKEPEPNQEVPAATEPVPQEVKNQEPPTQEPPKTETPSHEPVAATPSVQTKTPSVAPAPAPSTPMGLVKAGRLSAAAASWKKSLMPRKSHYTIQLEIACQDNTVLEAFQILNDSPQISVVPLDYKGKACYRVLYGVYKTTTEAETDRAHLPQEFLKQQSPAQVIPLAKALK